MPSTPMNAPSVCDRSGSKMVFSSTSASIASTSSRLIASLPRRNSSMCSGEFTAVHSRRVGAWPGRTRTRTAGGRLAARTLVVLASVVRSCSRWSPATCARRPSTPTSSPTAPRGAARRQRALADRRADHRRGRAEATRRDLLAARPIIESVASDDRRRPRLHEPVPNGGPRRPPRPVRARPGHRHADGRGRRHGRSRPRSRSCARRSRAQVESTERVELVRRDIGQPERRRSRASPTAFGSSRSC